MRTSDFYPELCWEDIRGLRLERVAQSDFGFRKIAVTAVPRTDDRGAGDGDDDRRSIEGRSKVVNDGTRRREGEGGRILEGKRETDPSLLFISQLCPRCPSALGRLRIWISREG